MNPLKTVAIYFYDRFRNDSKITVPDVTTQILRQFEEISLVC